MTRRIALIFLEPATGHADHFDSWLSDFVDEVVGIRGVLYLQQFAARAQFLAFPPPPGSCVVLVEIDGEAVDSETVARRLGDLLSPTRLGDHVNQSQLRACLLEEFRAEMRVSGLPDDLRQRHPRDLLVFFLGPVAGQEDAYHEWYDRAHIRNGLTLDGFVTGQRFRTGPAILDSSVAPSEFAAIYEIYGEDLDTAIAAAKNSAGRHEQSAAADPANMRAYALSSRQPVVRPGDPSKSE